MAYLAVISEDGGYETCYVSFKDKVVADGALQALPTVTPDTNQFTAGTPTLNDETTVVNGISHPPSTLLTFVLTAASNTAGAISAVVVDYTTVKGDGAQRFKVKRTTDAETETDGAVSTVGTVGPQGPAGGSTFSDPLVVNVTATAAGDGTGVIGATATFAEIANNETLTVSSPRVSDDYIPSLKVSLPPATLGKILIGHIGDTGTVMIPAISSGELIDNGNTSTIIPANTDFTLTCTTAGEWEVECKGRYTKETDISPTINSYLAARRPVVLPPGYFDLGSPIVMGLYSGQSIVGAGRTDVLIHADQDKSGHSTRLIYTDTAATGLPAITLWGSELDIENFSIYGVTPTDDASPPAQKAGAAILLKTIPSDGLGDGKIRAKGIGIFGFTMGVQIGELETDFNADVSLWENMVFRNVESCVFQKATQALEHTWEKCQFRHDCTYAFNIAGGGHLVCRDSLVSRGLEFIHFCGEASSANNPGRNSLTYRTGKNQRNIVIDHLKVDALATASDGYSHIGCTAPLPTDGARVYFIRPTIAGTDAWTEGSIDDGISLTIENPSYASTSVTPFTVSAVAEP